jgi:hypothetical protein
MVVHKCQQQIEGAEEYEVPLLSNDQITVGPIKRAA